jgi:hemolysin activation/secretion protein
LLSVEKLAIGGARTVRGYRENQLVRDQGLIASLELRVPLLFDDSGESRVGLTLAPFVDFGIGKDKYIGVPGLDDPRSDELFSVGAGLLWNWWKPLYVEVYYGADLKDAASDSGADSWQENGFHALVNLSWSL